MWTICAYCCSSHFFCNPRKAPWFPFVWVVGLVSLATWCKMCNPLENPTTHTRQHCCPSIFVILVQSQQYWIWDEPWWYARVASKAIDYKDEHIIGWLPSCCCMSSVSRLCSESLKSRFHWLIKSFHWRQSLSLFKIKFNNKFYKYLTCIF